MSARKVDGLERWWIKTPVPARVAICKAAGLPGRLGARRFSALTDEQKEALNGQIC